MFSAMFFNLNLRVLGVFQPGTQISKRAACLTGCACFSGLHLFPQVRDHPSNGPQFLRNGGALSLKRAAFFICSDQYHVDPCLLC